jgi:hypothetical protein
MDLTRIQQKHEREVEKQDGGLKPEVVISQLVDVTGTKFQMLLPHF